MGDYDRHREELIAVADRFNINAAGYRRPVLEDVEHYILQDHLVTDDNVALWVKFRDWLKTNYQKVSRFDGESTTLTALDYKFYSEMDETIVRPGIILAAVKAVGFGVSDGTVYAKRCRHAS